MKKGGMYNAELLQATETHNDPANIFDRRDAQRNKKLSEWMERRKAVDVRGDDEGYFSDILTADDDFQGIAKTVMRSPFLKHCLRYLISSKRKTSIDSVVWLRRILFRGCT